MYRVTNGNAFIFDARFDGQDYSFPPATPVLVDNDAATHIFGLGQQDKDAVLCRHGWSTFSNTRAAGMAILNAFSFEHLEPSYDDPLASQLALGHGPAPVSPDATPAGKDSDGFPSAGAAVAASVKQPALPPPAPQQPVPATVKRQLPPSAAHIPPKPVLAQPSKGAAAAKPGHDDIV